MDGKLVFGMDVNDRAGGKGGIYALDAGDGRLSWFFDAESGQTCTPFPGDDMRRFDSYHSEAELGLPPGFLSTRVGCDFPRSPNGCGNVWSSPAVDEQRDLIYIASSNCDTDDDPDTLEPSPPMPPYDEALLVLNFAGEAVWRWRPREVDNDDLAFGAAPNLFTAVIAEEERAVVGIGNKDGTYYLLDRDGVNEVNGVRWDDLNNDDLPYWATNVVPGGPAGGILATAAVDREARRIYFGTAPGFGPFDPQRPTVHALDADTGAVLWQNTAEPAADATFSPTSAIPGVVFTGTVLGGFLRSYDAATGEKLGSIGVGVAVASAPVVIDGLVMVGAGIGTRGPNPESPADISSRVPQNLTALCVPGTAACTRDVRLSGRQLNVVDDAQKPGRRRLRVRSEDSSFTPPSPGGLEDPTLVGATLELVNPVSYETQILALPASRWAGLGEPAGVKGYRYQDPKREDGPCTDAVLKPGRLRARCRGAELSFMLEGSPQEALAVALRVANEVTYCMRFGGEVQRDVPTTESGRGVFKARNAPPPVSCPLPRF